MNYENKNGVNNVGLNVEDINNIGDAFVVKERRTKCIDKIIKLDDFLDFDVFINKFYLKSLVTNILC
jgi:hypothetical protein